MSDTAKISIAMAVYNGERFIREQLDSYLRQTRLPDELVVSDNASTDSTLEIVREFAARAPFPVRIFINDRNLGVSKNFERAITESTGDIIFLSDCDDVWRPDKISLMQQAIDESADVGLALCDCELVDEQLNPLGSIVSELYGCCMAFRGKFKSLILPMPVERYFEKGGHDNFILHCIGGVGARVAHVAVPLVAYRQHRAQMHRAIHTQWQARKERPLHLLQPLIERLSTDAAREMCVNQEMREARVRHWRTRLSLPVGTIARIPVIARELLSGRYSEFSEGYKSFLKDLLFVR